MGDLAPLLKAIIVLVVVVYAILVILWEWELHGMVELLGECLTSWKLTLACVLFLLGLALALYAHFEGHSRFWVVLGSLIAIVAAAYVIRRPEPRGLQ